MQERLVRRVLSEPGDPRERLLEFRDRTQGFVDRFPEREGWTDSKGESWHAQNVLEAIDKLVEEIDLMDVDDDFPDEDDLEPQ